MTTVHHAHQRPSPNGKKHVGKGSRASLTLKTASSSKLPKIPEIKAVKEKVSEAVAHYGEGDDDSDGMAVSFLQFCTSCDKQILVPNNSLLYCSEICRRRDANRPFIRDPVFGGYVMGHAKTEWNEEPFNARPIVPPHQPTARPPISTRILQKSHNGKSDLDPTEWKPAEPDHGKVLLYLNQLHRSTSTLASNKSGCLALESRGNTSVITTTPSLSHTPTPSEFSKESSFAATPYEFVPRDIQYAASATFTSIQASDLVMPRAESSITASFAVKDREAKASFKTLAHKNTAKNGSTTVDIPGVMMYDKKVLGPATPNKGSLKMLFGDKGRM